MKYRKKPVIIEAMHFKTNNDLDSACMKEIAKWIEEGGTHVRNDLTNLYIDTLEGEMKASVGDYIIKGVMGEFYPCNPDIFEMTYEAV